MNFRVAETYDICDFSRTPKSIDAFAFNAVVARRTPDAKYFSTFLRFFLIPQFKPAEPCICDHMASHALCHVPSYHQNTRVYLLDERETPSEWPDKVPYPWSKKMLPVAALLVVSLGVSSAQELSFGTCPTFPVVQNFDVNRVRLFGNIYYTAHNEVCSRGLSHVNNFQTRNILK